MTDSPIRLHVSADDASFTNQLINTQVSMLTFNHILAHDHHIHTIYHVVASCLRNNCLDIVWNNRAIAHPQDLQVGMTNLVIVFALGFAKQF